MALPIIMQVYLLRGSYALNNYAHPVCSSYYNETKYIASSRDSKYRMYL